MHPSVDVPYTPRRLSRWCPASVMLLFFKADLWNSQKEEEKKLFSFKKTDLLWRVNQFFLISVSIPISARMSAIGVCFDSPIASVTFTNLFMTLRSLKEA